MSPAWRLPHSPTRGSEQLPMKSRTPTARTTANFGKRPDSRRSLAAEPAAPGHVRVTCPYAPTLMELASARIGALARVRVGRAGLLIGAAVATGLGLRIWVLTSSVLGALDGDEAVWGLMARRFLHGDLSVFFWHQGYGGTQETFLTAGVFWLFGSSVATLRIVPIALYAIAALLVWRVGRRTIGERAATVGALLFWVWPSYFVWRSVKEYGFYGAALLLGLSVMLLVL